VIETAAPPAPRLSSRSKALFVLFGVFLGPLGAHNFYAGFHIKAVAQLAITVLTFGYGLPMSWLWAVIDVCTVEQDRAGAQFRA
jgi:TM2 domain-containing membrane protein YozV